MMYGEKTTGWKVRLFSRSHPILYGFWHAYKFCVTQTFRSFWPIVTFFRKGLLRSGDTVSCFSKLITMEITIGALLLGMGPHIRRLNTKCHSLGLARPANRRSRLRYAVCKAMQVLLTEYCSQTVVDKMYDVLETRTEILNYLTFGPTQVEEMDDTEFGGPLPITWVMWYFDTHLHYLKNDKSFKPSFVSIDHQPDLVCKTASIEPDSRMYFLGVSTDNLSDWVNRVQTQLNHVLTQGSKLDEFGDWDQQGNRANRGNPLWVREEKLGSEALSLKEEETV